MTAPTVVTGRPAPPCQSCGRDEGSWRWRMPDGTILCGPCRPTVYQEVPDGHKEEAQHRDDQVAGQVDIFDALADEHAGEHPSPPSP